MNADLGFLISAVYDRSEMHPDHLADLRKSGLTDATIAPQKIRTVPPAMIDKLLGFSLPAVTSAYAIPFPDPRGGWMDVVRMKIFPTTLTDTEGHRIKYVQRRGSPVRPFFPLATLDAVRYTDEPLWVIEGEKKALLAAQLGLPSIGICGVEGWHVGGARTLHPDLIDIGLRGRVVKLVPDSDVVTNPNVLRAVQGFAAALTLAGAVPRLVHLPVPVA